VYDIVLLAVFNIGLKWFSKNVFIHSF